MILKADVGHFVGARPALRPAGVGKGGYGVVERSQGSPVGQLDGRVEMFGHVDAPFAKYELVRCGQVAAKSIHALKILSPRATDERRTSRNGLKLEQDELK